MHSSSVFIAALLLSCQALAQEKSGGLFVEPLLTYETSSSTVNYPSPLSNSTGKVDGFGLGARLGFHVSEALFVALDARYSMPQFTDSSVSYNAAAKAYNWGPVIGVQMPNIGGRVWGTYIAGAALDPERSGSFDVKLDGGTGYRVGVGFRVAAVGLSLEYQQVQYPRATLEQLGPFTPTANFNSVVMDNRSWILGVSFPIEL